jgi:outer membrane biosynthesis protein TonB
MAGARRSPVGLIGSVLLHISIIGATLFTFAHKLDITEESPPVVPVELVTIAPKTNLMATVKVRPKVQPKEEEPVTPPEPQKIETPPPPEEKPQPEKLEQKPEPKPVEAPPEPKPKAVEPPPEPKPEPVETPPPPPPEIVKPKPEAKLPPPAEAKSVPKIKLHPVAPKAEATTKKDQFDIDSVMALLDKRAPTSKSAPNARVANKNVKAFGPQDAMTVDLQDSLRSQIQQCWSPPVGAPRPEELVVEFELFLKPDGSVAQPPQLSAESQSAVSHDSFARAAAEAARRAIYTCAPYKLPQDRYGQWQDITLTFDPRHMIGD